MLNQKNNAVNPSRDLFILNKSVNKIRAFNAAIPSDFSTVSKSDAARIKKEALELVDLVSYALNQRDLKIDVLDDEKKRIETTKHTSIVYYSLNLIASQLDTTARKIAEKLETEPTTTEPETTTTEPTTTEPTTTEAETTETKTTEPEKVETIPTRFAAVNPYSGAPDLIKTVFLHDCKKTIRAYKIAPAAAETLEKFAVEFETALKCRSKFVEKALEIRDKFAAWLEKENIFSVELDDREAPFRLTRLDGLKNATKDSRSASIRQDVKKLVDEIRHGLTGKKNWKWLNPWIETEMYKTEAQPETDAPAAVVALEPKQEPAPVVVKPKQEETPAPVQEPAAVVVLEPKQTTPAPVVDNRDALINETFDAITKRIIKASEAVPYMLEKSIKEGCPLWSQKWFSFAELPRKYFDGTLYSVNNMVLMGFHAGFYISESEARRLLGAKIKPDARAVARRVLMPVFKDAKTPNKQELDALRNCEPIADETKTRRPDFYRVEKVYDQTAFNGLTIKKSRELPNNENERNARAEKVLREFCAANNIVFSSVLGLGQAVCEHVENPAAPIRINVPDISQFKSSTSYYSVVFHECTHAANRRNGCQLTKNREELAAEIGACIVLNSLGFEPAEYIDDAGAYVKQFKDTASEKNAIKKAWKYAQSSALLILKSFIDDAIHADDDAPKQETKQEEAPASVKNDDEESIVSALETFEREATQAINTFGIVHQDNARRAENDALLAIEEARKNMSVPDDALRIYSDRVERIHVDTALALKKEAARRYGSEWIDRHVTFC